MKVQAIRPDFAFKSMPSMQKASTGEGPTEEEKALHSMSKSSGWLYFSRFKDELIRDMERINRQAISSGMNFEQIGQNTLIINMVTDIADRLFTKVSDAVEAVEQNAAK